MLYIGSRIQEYRKKAELSQEEFADNTNLLNQLNMLYARACTCSLLAFTILV